MKIRLPDDMHAALHDGVLLCHLANHLRPHSVSTVHVPSPSVVLLLLLLECCRRCRHHQHYGGLSEPVMKLLVTSDYASLLTARVCWPRLRISANLAANELRELVAVKAD